MATPHAARADATSLRRIVLVMAGLQMAFWIYAIVYILHHPNPRGDGLEIMHVIPMTLILLCLTAPALVLAIWDRTLMLAVVFVLAATTVNAAYWSSIHDLGPHWDWLQRLT